MSDIVIFDIINAKRVKSHDVQVTADISNFSQKLLIHLEIKASNPCQSCSNVILNESAR